MTTFDHIVVGAGSAGCVLAARLSEDPARRVLLLEAGGPDRSPHIHTPAAFPKLFKGACDWGLSTEPQEHLDGRRLYWPRGKVLGGSSSLNAMIYIRGHARDYDEWAEAGNAGWAYEDVLPLFKRSENQQRGPSAHHGTGGPLDVCDPLCPHPLSAGFLDACAEVGLPRNADFNGPTQEGVGMYQLTQKGGKRASAATAFLRPALSRANLAVRTGAHATRISFAGTRATGVRYLHQGKEAHAEGGEVILCGGAIHSPHLLLLSGIGPAEELRRLEIPLVVDLPGVGKNLQDHLIAGIICQCSRTDTLDRAENWWNILRYLFRRSGPLTSNVAEAGGFVRSDPSVDRPDLQMHFGPAFYVEHGFVRPAGHGFSLGMCVLRPESRGEITLASADPRKPPRIQPRYLESGRDRDLLVEGLRLARRIVSAEPLARYHAGEYLPGSEVKDADLAGYLRAHSHTLYHPVGTCKMGTDDRAVVDPALRVRGVTGLRVADASVMPTLIGGNTNAAALMIGEKAADLILDPSGESPS